MRDVVIVGAGIVGLATAYQLLKLKPGLKLLVVDKEEGPARHQTGHNSGVIHSGVYYRPGSLKAQNCRRGYDLLIEFCKEQSVPFEICGKLIVATDEGELQPLAEIFNRGQANGLSGLRELSQQEAREIEPHVNCIKALWVPQAGIVDYKEVSAALLKQIRAMGGEVRFREKVLRLEELEKGGRVVTQRSEHDGRHILNCAGLHSDRLAAWLNFKMKVRIIPFRGEYYKLKPSAEGLVRNLIYPVPDPRFPFLGVHFTRMIKGGIEAGPNAVLAFQREGYSWRDVRIQDLADTLAWPGFYRLASRYWRTGLEEMTRSLSRSGFAQSLQKLVPQVQESDLEPAGSGVRAQACTRDGRLVDDFFILENSAVTHVLNAPSPAATASLSIGLHLAEGVVSKLGG